MRVLLRLVSVTALALGLAGAAAGLADAQAVRSTGERPHVALGRIEGVINPLTARYVERVVRAAEEGGAAAVVFTMDTPGGLIDSTYKITGTLLNARVPVVIFVAPSGAHAASAGTFITLAGHVAAMAPATNIGAAHPVSASGGDIEGDLRLKAENDAVAQITKIAKARGRNEQWAEDAVRKSVSIREDEAVRIGVIDVVATDVPDLLARIDGRTVVLPHQSVTLRTRGAPIDEDPRNPLEIFLHLITDPQIAVLLFTLGTYGLVFELSNPSLIFPGVVGIICIVLALFAFGTLDANAAGIALMLFAIAMLAAEFWVPSHGILAVGGIAALVLGTIIVLPPFRPTFPGFRYSVEPLLIGGIVAVTGAFFAFVVRESLRYRTLRTEVGAETLAGLIGEVRKELAPVGIVRVADEDWTAVSASGAPIATGALVRVRRVDGVRLIVEPAEATAEGRVPS